MNARTILWALVFVVVFTLRSAAQDVREVEKWHECDEFIPRSKPCKVIVNMGIEPDGNHRTRVPWDVTINPGGKATVLLQHGSPYLSCTLAATPGPLSRDVSTSFSTFLTTLGTLGAWGNLVLPQKFSKVAPRINAPTPEAVPNRLNQLLGALSGTDASQPAFQIDAQLSQMEEDIESALGDIPSTVSLYASVQNTVHCNWHNTYRADSDFIREATTLWPALNNFLKQSLPNIASIEMELRGVSNAMAEFHRQFDTAAASDPRIVAWLKGADARIEQEDGNVKLLQDYITDLSSVRTQLKQAKSFLDSISDGSGNFNKGPYTETPLPMTGFAQKQVTEAITCKDAVSQTQAFDTITFTAYYEPSPTFDFSAGALVSFLGGHQVGTISGPLSQATAAACQMTPPGAACTAAPTMLGVTSNSTVQWIPTAFFEFHPNPLNFKCPWATTGSPKHTFGYVCSFGPAFGLSVNPNNGTTTAEYFEGISLGIQRVAIFFGNHTGRFQEFTEGYYVGETNIPAGTTPPTTRRWTNHFAIGISYRIPLR